ncbi:MAG TPA: methyltransferase domain-containing protein, partial [Geobacteraceae bacterium]|nr:methyltransferase domain-containing protein [Geobacteraceae bacterium]
MTQIDRTRVRRAFSEKADSYDALAVVQQRVVMKFLERIITLGNEPSTLLDVGAGTGRLLESLLHRYPSVFAVGLDMAHGMARSAARRLPAGSNATLVCGDGEHLPFRDCSFDMVVSTSTYQWLTPLDSAFREAIRVLRPGGRFCFAMFGESTLMELKESYRRALLLHGSGTVDRSHRFSSRAETLVALERAGFMGCRVTSEMEVEIHPDVPALLRSLKGIGAGNAAAVRGKGLGGRSVTAAMI